MSSDPHGFGARTVQLYEAMKARDVAAVDQVLAQSFVFTTFVGSVGNRALYLEVLAKGLMTIEAFQLEPIGVLLHDAAAVVVYRLHIQAHAGPNRWPPLLTSTDTWVKDGGGWKLAARHSSVVTQG